MKSIERVITLESRERMKNKRLGGKKDMPWIKFLIAWHMRNLLFSTVTIIFLSNLYFKEHRLIRGLQQINEMDR